MSFNLYQTSLALLTDLYQLTMAYGYWKTGSHQKETVFNLFFRKHPFGGQQTLFCGLSRVATFLRDFRFTDDDLGYLNTLEGNDGKPLFDQDFLKHLANTPVELEVDAVPEGSIVFPHQPLLRVRGPIIQCQILETALLNIVNFHTLIATKAARVVAAADGDPVLEFGLRRAQGIDGALSASWAAYMAGCEGTSNVLAGKLFGIPIRGTHAHSWIMSFPDEPTAFRAYADAMPNNCVFLVDTYDTVEGVHNAVAVGRTLKEQGYLLAGIRLDSGDLTDLSIKARHILDEAGFEEARIFASNDLDEHAIDRLKQKGAKICMWGVGTKLVTAYDQPALGGVYKLAAVRSGGEAWQYKVKLSEETIKVSNPGVQQIRRYTNGTSPIADMIWDEDLGPGDESPLYGFDGSRHPIPNGCDYEDLLIPVMRNGSIKPLPDLEDARAHALAQQSYFKGIGSYPTGLEPRLHDLKQHLILKARGGA